MRLIFTLSVTVHFIFFAFLQEEDRNVMLSLMIARSPIFIFLNFQTIRDQKTWKLHLRNEIDDTRRLQQSQYLLFSLYPFAWGDGDERKY